MKKDKHIDKVVETIKTKYATSFPDGKIIAETNTDSKIFNFVCEFVSQRGKQPSSACRLNIVIMPQVNQFRFDFNQVRQGAVFIDTTNANITTRFDEIIRSYVDKFRDLLEFTNTKVDPLDRFIKEVVSETDLYYTLTGLSKEERLDKFTEDMKRINEANKPPTEAEIKEVEKKADEGSKPSLSLPPGEE